jgi:protein-disulfide isomerase
MRPSRLFVSVMMLCLSIVAAAPALAAAGPDLSHDSRVKDFLQKRFHIASTKDIALGAPTPSPFPGLWTRTLTVTTPSGSVKTFIYTDAAQDKIIIGQYIDLRTDPWGRIDTDKLRLTDRATQGPDNAPVTIVEFADFECPFCARAFDQIETIVNNRYKGKVKLIFKNFPLSMHPWARPAAIAAECIRRQNPADFWEFAQILYSSQAQIDPNNLRSRVENYAKAAKLDTQALDQCMMGKSAEEVISQDLSDGALAHVQSTPTFLINGIPVVGLPEEKSFEFVIKSELKDGHTAEAGG